MSKSPLVGKPQRSPFSDYSSIVPPRAERGPIERSPDDIYARGMERLVTVAQELSHARSLEAVQQIVRTAARQLTGADGATFVLREGDQCHYADEDGIAPLWKGRRFPMSTCISGWVMVNRCPAVLEDIYSDDRIPAEAYRPTFVKSLVMVPIRTSDPIGAIGNYWARRHMPTHVELRLLSALADSTSIALENVRLFGELETRVRECSDALVAAQRAEEETRREMVERQRAEEALRRSQDQLHHAQKMEAVGQLAAGIAHDFNNVLSVVLSYTAMISSQLEPGSPLQADADEVLRAGERAAALTRQLLTFSRQQVVEPKVMGLNGVIAGAENMLRRLIGSNIELLIKPLSRTDRMMADPGQVEQVLVNLTVNARDAISQSGKLTIETADVRVIDQDPVHEGVAPGEYVALSVTDTGHGMSADVRSRVFEPFFTTKDRGKGTGLGLSNVHGIVQQSAGRITVTSEPGAGSTFSILWPRYTDTIDQVTRTTSAALGGSETVLLVEDDEHVRAVASGVLRRNGYKVLEARGSGEAILTCEQHGQAIDLLVADVVMPQLNGVQLARRLAASYPRLRVLCTSGHAMPPELHASLEPGTAYLQKPFRPDGLLRKVREVLDGVPAPGRTDPAVMRTDAANDVDETSRTNGRSTPTPRSSEPPLQRSS